jgi:hypothetical protein
VTVLPGRADSLKVVGPTQARKENMTDDDNATELIRQIQTEIQTLREEQAKELTQIKAAVARIELKLQQRVGV